jgi:hypothetical protein
MIELIKRLADLMERSDREEFEDDAKPVTSKEWFAAIGEAKALIAQVSKEPPKDRPVLLNVGYPWMVVGIWNEAQQEFATAELEWSSYEGKDDPAWVTEWAKPHEVKNWMPPPHNPEHTGLSV